MKVAIAGSFSAINRHASVLEKLNDVQIAGCWSLNGRPDEATDQLTGLHSKPEKIVESTDALIITDSGPFYINLAIRALRNARHVFIYPSVARSLNDVYQLIKLGCEANVILKCGRTGRYGVTSLVKRVNDVKSVSIIDFHHSVKINNGAAGALSDVLLGDMEIICRLIHARNTSVKAKGLSLLSSKPAVINARLEFDNGAAVNYYCNMMSTRNEHLISVVLKDSVLSYDLINNQLSGWYVNKGIDTDENPIFIEDFEPEQGDYLLDDLSAFIGLTKSGPAFLSIYDNGFESFLLSDRILEKVSKTLVQFV